MSSALHLETQLRVEPAALGWQAEQRRIGEEAGKVGVDEGLATPKPQQECSGASDLGDESEAVGLSRGSSAKGGRVIIICCRHASRRVAAQLVQHAQAAFVPFGSGAMGRR